MEAFAILINTLAALLVRCGVTTDRSLAAALLLLYLLVTLAVLGLLVVVLRRGRRTLSLRVETPRTEDE